MLDMIDVVTTTDSVATDFTPEAMDSQNELGKQSATCGLHMQTQRSLPEQPTKSFMQFERSWGSSFVK